MSDIPRRSTSYIPIHDSGEEIVIILHIQHTPFLTSTYVPCQRDETGGWHFGKLVRKKKKKLEMPIENLGADNEEWFIANVEEFWKSRIEPSVKHYCSESILHDTMTLHMHNKLGKNTCRKANSLGSFELMNVPWWICQFHPPDDERILCPWHPILVVGGSWFPKLSGFVWGHEETSMQFQARGATTTGTEWLSMAKSLEMQWQLDMGWKLKVLVCLNGTTSFKPR